MSEIKYKDGSKYEGEVVNGFPHGKGTMLYEDGYKYEGDWKDGFPHGKGIMTGVNGVRFEGEWELGNRHEGTIFFPDGVKMIIHFKEPKTGRVELIHPTLGHFGGELEDGKMAGKWVEYRPITQEDITPEMLQTVQRIKDDIDREIYCQLDEISRKGI